MVAAVSVATTLFVFCCALPGCVLGTTALVGAYYFYVRRQRMGYDRVPSVDSPGSPPPPARVAAHSPASDVACAALADAPEERPRAPAVEGLPPPEEIPMDQRNWRDEPTSGLEQRFQYRVVSA